MERDPEVFARVAIALEAASQVVALRPAADAERCLQVLRARCLETKGHHWQVDAVHWLARWLGDEREEHLATDVVHTAGEDSQTAAGRIAALALVRQGR